MRQEAISYLPSQYPTERRKMQGTPEDYLEHDLLFEKTDSLGTWPFVGDITTTHHS